MHICETHAGAASIASYIAMRTVLGNSLACPLLVIWWDYLQYCRRWGFEVAPAYDFVPWLLALNGVGIIEGGRGRHKRCIIGLGVIPTEKDKT